MNSDDTPRECDLVLEGGVTSALVYCGLIARLSKVYRFRRLGGTSAGAVAAAAAAIAELTRTTRKSSRGFDALHELPEELAKTDGKGGPTALYRLFQPHAEARAGFRVVTAAMRHKGWRALLVAAFVCLWVFPWFTLFGALPGLALLGYAVVNENGGALAAASALLMLFLSPAAAIGLGLRRTLRAMASKGYGLCTGMKEPHDAADDAVTTRLHELFNRLAGREASDPPVVFGALWHADPQRPTNERAIDLQVITTALSLGRPYRIPGDSAAEDPLREFCFDPNEWKDLFPEAVLRWMRENARSDGGESLVSAQGRPLLRLPEPAALPVIVAVRLSLSFPGLLSAVPMHRIEVQRPGVRQRDGTVPVTFALRRIYFSDGGITSNCPVHLFDAALPTRRPTFGADLRRIKSHSGSRRPRRVVWMDGDRRAPVLDEEQIERGGGTFCRAFHFIAAIVATSLNWRDSLQRSLPGYAERVVNIGLAAEEGGLNLTMPPSTILRLRRVGSAAAVRLIADFAGPRTQGRLSGWDRHRWIRMRSTLAAASAFAGEVAKARREAQRDPQALDPQALDPQALNPQALNPQALLSQSPTPPPSLVDAAAIAHAAAVLEAWSAIGTQAAEDALAANAPRPAPHLRMTPPW